MIAFCQSAIADSPGVVLIEGIGGIMVPLDGSAPSRCDDGLQLPLILVAGSYLGTISHTLTALDALYRRGMKVLAIIVSETPGSTVPLDEAVAAIGRFVEPVIGLPRPRPALGQIERYGFRARSHFRAVAHDASIVRESAIWPESAPAPVFPASLRD